MTRKTMLVAVLALPACMTTQPPSSYTSTAEELHLEGFASKPSGLIALQAYNRATEEWQPVGVTNASAGGFTFGGRDLYQWKLDWIMNDAIPDMDLRECFWSSDCIAPYGGTIRLRATEPLGDAKTLYTFRPGGLDCTIQRVIQEVEDLEVAYWNCHPDGIENEIAVYMDESEYPF